MSDVILYVCLGLSTLFEGIFYTILIHYKRVEGSQFISSVGQIRFFFFGVSQLVGSGIIWAMLIGYFEFPLEFNMEISIIIGSIFSLNAKYRVLQDSRKEGAPGDIQSFYSTIFYIGIPQVIISFLLIL